MITIVDYGLGNIRAFVNVYDRLNIKSKIANSKEDLKDAQKIILPGVGSFDYAMSQLNSSGMRDELEYQVLERKIPVMGICVGMQMLSKNSEEGKLDGLGWIDGEARLFDVSLIPYKTQLPHMGWNSVSIKKENNLLRDFDSDSRFYFLHSYYFHCNKEEDVIAETEYGLQYASAVKKDNIYGVQFHPEKSHNNGTKLLSNFANL